MLFPLRDVSAEGTTLDHPTPEPKNIGDDTSHRNPTPPTPISPPSTFFKYLLLSQPFLTAVRFLRCEVLRLQLEARHKTPPRLKAPARPCGDQAV